MQFIAKNPKLQDLKKTNNSLDSGASNSSSEEDKTEGKQVHEAMTILKERIERRFLNANYSEGAGSGPVLSGSDPMTNVESVQIKPRVMKEDL
jgi:hypothetical protein